ncbi:MAG: hypothetical protein WA823_15880 [Candidatus Acidiferrales bacterium]
MQQRLELMATTTAAFALGFPAGRRKCLQFFAGLESNRLARRNAHLLPGSGVPADAGLARLHIKNAEAAQFDTVAAAQGILHRLENGLDGLFGFRAGNVRFLHDRIYDV